MTILGPVALASQVGGTGFASAPRPVAAPSPVRAMSLVEAAQCDRGPSAQRAYKNLLMKQDDDVLSDEASNRRPQLHSGA